MTSLRPPLNGKSEREMEELGSLAYGPNNVTGSYFHTYKLLSHCLRDEQLFAAQNLHPYSPSSTKMAFFRCDEFEIKSS
jgi:hypothetical protein